MIYELRVYHCVPGRLPNLLKRFDTITLKLWEKHGIRQAGFWTVLVLGAECVRYDSARDGLATFISTADRDNRYLGKATADYRQKLEARHLRHVQV